jgi:hypothetical protein
MRGGDQSRESGVNPQGPPSDRPTGPYASAADLPKSPNGAIPRARRTPIPSVRAQCVELAQALLPVAIEWLRASATPASLCSAAGVCGTALLGDAVWDKVGEQPEVGSGSGRQGTERRRASHYPPPPLS